MKPGLVAFSNNKKGFLPAIVRFFTNSKYSHTFITTAPVFNKHSVYEAYKTVQLVPFETYYLNDVNKSYVLFEVLGKSQEEINLALEKVYSEFCGVKYGFLQLLWFVYRAISEKFGIDVKKKKNWLSDGVICSELVYYYLVYLGLEELVKDFNPDTIQPQDLYRVVLSRPDLFKLISEKV